MEKNRIHQIKSGKNTRMSFAGQKTDVLEMPNLIDIQKASYDWFLEYGLKEVFRDVSPIDEGYSKVSLEFGEYTIQKDKMSRTIEDCKARDMTYAAPLKVKVYLTNKETGVKKEHDIFMGDLPIMTDTGSFVINGAERVIVSQIVRSPGIYFDMTHDKIGKELYTNQIIPNRGAWLEFETDSNDIFYARLDRQAKVPITCLVRALGESQGDVYGTDDKIRELFGDEPKIEATFTKEKPEDKSGEGALKFIYSKIRSGEPATLDSSRTLFNGMFFDERRYDLAHVGRYKFNKKLNLKYRLAKQTLFEDVIDPSTGAVLEYNGVEMKAGTELTRELGEAIQNSGVEYVMVQYIDPNTKEKKGVKVISNQMVDASQYLSFDPAELEINELVYYPVLMQILEENETEDEQKLAIKKRMKELVPPHVTAPEIIASVSYLLNLQYGIGTTDDIDHLGNRRIRAIGELLQNQYRLGMSRLERVVRERMSTLSDVETVTPQQLINIKPVTAAVKEFFGSSQLSQFMDQNNPLSELTHKRRLSALGPGGLSRERAGFEVRDVHYTHYGRMCPIETPEGPNIGLINSLASFARVNKYGFIEAPYRLVDKSDPENPVVTEKVVYLTADEEDDFVVAQANTKLDKEGHFVNANVSGRFREETAEFPKERVDLMDVSPKMVFSVATSMIPFLENDDANRALMGSNMQRQAVPLMLTEAPAVDTGLAAKAAKDSGVCVVAKRAGTVKISASNEIIIATEDGSFDTYQLKKFERSNQSNSYNQKPIVVAGEHVEAGQVIADGPSTCNGEIALGRNPLIGFMTWEGYNYEDAVLLSERLVQQDAFTSIHIEKYEIEARETKLGAEDITRDVPGVGEDALKELDANGVIRIGAQVRAGDILVGKVTPKGEADQSPEERLLRAIFSEKAREVRDTSLRVPHGAYGTVIAANIFDRQSNPELTPGVTKAVRVYIAQKRKISVGDKMAGRHGNKGVVSRVLPVEDMPYLPNGRPLDIVLNPLGVPSRMNIGQILEVHLSLAAKVLGVDVSTPVFDGAHEKEIGDLLEFASDYANMDDFNEFRAKYEADYSDELLDYLGAHLEHRALWKGVQIGRDGKVQLCDGRTGEPFDSKTTIGHMHYLKLHHLVDDKIHARSTGPYSLVTQQPLGGKAQFGGQRFGEMEVWALEAYGASYTLQEILTVKSDDVAGRVKTYEAIIKGEPIPKAGIPESFKVLLKELQSLALDVRALRSDGTEVEIRENIDDGSGSFTQVENSDQPRRRRNQFEETDIRDAQADMAEFMNAGFSAQEFDAFGELQEVADDTNNGNSSDDE